MDARAAKRPHRSSRVVFCLQHAREAYESIVRCAKCEAVLRDITSSLKFNVLGASDLGALESFLKIHAGREDGHVISGVSFISWCSSRKGMKRLGFFAERFR